MTDAYTNELFPVTPVGVSSLNGLCRRNGAFSKDIVRRLAPMKPIKPAKPKLGRPRHRQ
jgi:hypothetical protein